MPGSARGDTLGLCAAAALLLFAGLGREHLAPLDDCYYAQKAREMLASGDWLTPHYGGVPRFDNPPLFLWAMAASFAVLGVSSFSAILPSTLAGVLCVVALHRLALVLSDRVTALLAASVLLTTPYFLKYARHAMFDVFLTLLFVVAVAAALRARRGEVRWLCLTGLATGAGFLTKSVLGAFPLLVVAGHAAWTGASRRWWRGYAAAVGVSLLVALPWFAFAVARHGGAFLDEHVGWLLVERGFGEGAAERGYAQRFFEGYWPWLPVAGVALLVEARRALVDGDTTARLIVMWVAVVVGVMSLADAKDLRYVMVTFPALSLATARLLARGLRTPARERGLRRGLTAAAGVAVLALQLLPIPLSRPRRPDLHALALAAAAADAPAAPVVIFDADPHEAGLIFRFYAERPVIDAVPDAARFLAALQPGRHGLLRAAALDAGLAEELSVVAAAGPWRLVQRGSP